MGARFLDSLETGTAAKKAGHEHATAALAGLSPPTDELEALAFWTQLVDMIEAEIPAALASAGETYTWSAVGGALGTSPQAAAQRHRRYQARGDAS